MLKERCKPGHIIASVWHPGATSELVDTLHGNVRVLKGEARYQLSSGEIIEI